MKEEETRNIKVVGNYALGEAGSEDCDRCHNARFGSVIIDGICLACRDEKIIEKEVFIKLKRFASQSLSPDTFSNLIEILEELEVNRHIPQSK